MNFLTYEVKINVGAWQKKKFDESWENCKNKDSIPWTGVVQGWAAILMGVISGSIPWYTMMILHDKLPFLKQIDDPMAVFHTYAVTGALAGA